MSFIHGFVLSICPLLQFPHFLQVVGTNREVRNRARLPAPPRALRGSPPVRPHCVFRAPAWLPAFLPQDPLSALLGPKCSVPLVFGSRIRPRWLSTVRLCPQLEAHCSGFLTSSLSCSSHSSQGVCATPEASSRGREESLTDMSVRYVPQCESCFV